MNIDFDNTNSNPEIPSRIFPAHAAEDYSLLPVQLLNLHKNIHLIIANAIMQRVANKTNQS